MKAPARFCVGVLVFVIFGVLALVAAIGEDRKKRKLGKAYEGPLDGEEDL